MSYLKLNSSTHLILESKDRQKVDLESLYIRGGSYFEKPKHRGQKHLLEHCLVARTKNLDFQGFKDYQFAKNFMVNAATSPKHMWLEMAGHTLDFAEMLGFLLEMTYTPTFDQAILDQEREIVLREISERRGDPGYIVYYDTARQVYTPGSTSVHETLGDPEMVKQTTLEDFSYLHRQNLTAGEVIFTISGGFVEQEAIDMIAAYQQQLGNQLLKPSKQTKLDPSKDSFQDFQIKTYHHPLAHEHVDLTLYISAPINTQNLAIWKVFTELYLKFHGVIYDLLRNKHGLIYSLSTETLEDTQTLAITISCEFDNVQKIIDLVREVLSDFETHFSVTKFNQLKQVLVKKTMIAGDNPNHMAMFTQNNLLNYNQAVSYQEIIFGIENLSIQEFKDFYEQISQNLKQMKILAVSKKPKIENLKLA
jgi:predicted Zn-dependent peptidase